MLLLAVACRAGPPPAGIARVTLSRPPKDTVRFTVPATARPCGGGLLLLGQSRGNGILLWLRDSAAPAPGPYALRARGDTVQGRGASASIRWMTGDVAHGITVDAGRAVLETAAGPFGATVEGLGVETASALQHDVRAVFQGVALSSDTADCRVQP